MRRSGSISPSGGIAAWASGNRPSFLNTDASTIRNWTARLEYLYVDLQSATCNTTQCGFPVGDTIKFSTSMIRFGLDYKFR